MPNNELKVQVCDTTDDDSSTSAWLKIKNTVAPAAILPLARR